MDRATGPRRRRPSARYVHGGPHRAVSLLGIEAIERVQADGHPIEPGSVGENLTTTGIELSRLPVGTRLAIGDERGARARRRRPGRATSSRARFATASPAGSRSCTHPSDSRMYARVIAEGVVRAGDPIRCPAAGRRLGRDGSTLLDLLDDVDRERVAGACGGPRRRPATTSGSSTTATCRPPPARSLPGSIFNRAFGLRLVPIAIDRGPRPVSRRRDDRLARRRRRRAGRRRRAWSGRSASASTSPTSRSARRRRPPSRDWRSGRSTGRRTSSSVGRDVHRRGFERRGADRRGVAGDSSRSWSPRPRLPPGDRRARRARRRGRRDADAPSGRVARRRRPCSPRRAAAASSGR